MSSSSERALRATIVPGIAKSVDWTAKKSGKNLAQTKISLKWWRPQNHRVSVAKQIDPSSTLYSKMIDITYYQWEGTSGENHGIHVGEIDRGAIVSSEEK